MRKVITAAVLTAALALVPAFAFAQATPPAEKPKSGEKPAASTAKPATHSTSGVVKSVDASSLVLTKSGKAAEEMTFVLTPTTQKSGTIEPGAHATVRYTTEGKTNTATAVTAKPASKKEDTSKKQ
jgi:hypothetical protein